MSNIEHSRMVEDIQSDFAEKLQAEDWSGCSAMIDGLREAGYESEAHYLHKQWEKHLKEIEDAKTGEDHADYQDRRGY